MRRGQRLLLQQRSTASLGASPPARLSKSPSSCVTPAGAATTAANASPTPHSPILSESDTTFTVPPPSLVLTFTCTHLHIDGTYSTCPQLAEGGRLLNLGGDFSLFKTLQDCGAQLAEEYSKAKL